MPGHFSRVGAGQVLSFGHLLQPDAGWRGHLASASLRRVRAARHPATYWALLEVPPEEAMHFCCNGVVCGKEIVVPRGCPKLGEDLQHRGYTPHPLAMAEFIKAGGACKCLTLFLERSVASRQAYGP
jgi:N-dimethylarginine dimethylaminohydrolase